MDLTNTCLLLDHLVDLLDGRERPGQQVVVYLDSLHPYRDDQTLEDLILSARSELRNKMKGRDTIMEKHYLRPRPPRRPKPPKGKPAPPKREDRHGYTY